MKYAPYSYSKVKTHQQCPAKFDFKYRQRIKTETEPSDAIKRGLRLHGNLEQYIDDGPDYIEMEPELHRLGTKIERVRSDTQGSAVSEMEMGLTADNVGTDYKSDDAWIRGIADVMSIKPDLLEVYDLKTGSVNRQGQVYPDALAGHLEQLRLYGAIAMKWLAAELDHHVSVVSIEPWYADAQHEPRGCKQTMTAVDVEDTLKLWRKRTDYIEKSTVFPTRINKFCNWCEYSKKNGGPCTAA